MKQHALVVVIALSTLVGCLPPEPYSPPDAALPEVPSDAQLLAARPYHLAVPSEYDGGTPRPMMIALHGYGESSHSFVEEADLDNLAQRRQWFIAVPNGLPDTHGYRSWHPGPIHAPSFDVEYLTAIIHDLKAKYSIDPRRVYVFGFSQGAHMTHRMGCDASAEVVAFVSLAGQVTKVANQCAPANFVSALEMHGTEDEAIGYYGDVQHDPPDPTVPTAHETIATWARNDQCAGALAPTGVTLDLSTAVDGAESVVEAYGGCPPGISVELWTMNQVTHWPYPQVGFMEHVCDFLEAHPRPLP